MSLNPDTIKTGGVQDYPEYLLLENQVANAANVGLFKAALNNSIADCEKFLRQGAKPNFFSRPEDHKNSLHVASEHGYFDVVKLLLRNGAEVNSIVTSEQSSALTLAAAHNNDANLIKLLLDEGASINHGNGYGNTALHEACRSGHGATISVLLERGADVNAKNHKGSTPLHIFCYGEAKSGGHIQHTVALAEQLIRSGADINAVDARGASPILVACASGRIDLIELLVAHGGDLHHRDSKGQSARDVAEFYSQEATVKYLSSVGVSGHK